MSIAFEHLFHREQFIYSNTSKMKLLICLFFILNGSWTVRSKTTENNAKFKSETTKLAESILSEIHADRRAVLKEKVKGMSYSSLKSVRDTLKAKYDVVEKVNEEVDALKTMTNSEMKDALWKRLDGKVIGDLDSVAVMHSVKGDFLVMAANIETLSIPHLHDPELWADVLNIDKTYKFSYEDMGLRDSDSVAIGKALENSKNIDFKSRNIFIVNPEIQPSVVSTREFEDFKRITPHYEKIKEANLEVKSNQRGELNQNETNQRNQYQIETDIKKFNRAKGNMNRFPSAEIQLLNLKDQNSLFNLGSDSDIVHEIYPSKAEFVDFAQSERIFVYRKFNPKTERWEIKFHVTAKAILEENKNPDPTDLMGSCLKVAKGCVFLVKEANENSVGSETIIEEIHSDEFLKKYAEAETKARKVITDAVVTNFDKLVGSRQDMDKIKRLIDYEKMQKVKAKIDHSSQMLRTGDFFTSDSTSQFSSEELLAQTKLSPTKTAKAIQSRSARFPAEEVKVSGAVRTYSLAQNVINAINSGDTTSLDIVNGKVENQVSLNAIGQFGSKLGTKLGIQAAAKVASKRLRVLGETIGPLGSLADVGLSGWRLNNAVQRLGDRDVTKFQQNEAIADIVHGSTSIAITATVTMMPVIFPLIDPPFLFVGFFVNPYISSAFLAYKAHNHVNSLHSQIKLLGYERGENIKGYKQGRNTSPYLQNLIGTKIANNLIVAPNIDFLEQNPDVIGNVFPSRTFTVYGQCHLTQTLHWLYWDLQWHQRTIVVAHSCWGYGGPCDNYDRLCVYYYHHTNWVEKVEYKCHCASSIKTIFGNEHLNSMVDFRGKQNIFLERSVPPVPVNYEYELLCSPSSLLNRGNRVSQESQTYGYNCENAMAVQRTSQSGKYMLYNLGTGDDQIYLNHLDKTNNQIVVDAGIKRFYGSAGMDTFSVTGTCSKLEGTIDGGQSGEDNVLALGKTCLTGKNLTVDLQRELMTSGNEVNMRILNLQMVYGRNGERDEIQAGCDSKRIDGRGGRSNLLRDIVHVPDLNCDIMLYITAANYTTINLSHSRGNVVVLIPRGEKVIDFIHWVNSTIKLTSYTFKMTSRLLTNVSVNRGLNGTTRLVLTFEIDSSATFTFSVDQDIKPSTLSADQYINQTTNPASHYINQTAFPVGQHTIRPTHLHSQHTIPTTIPADQDITLNTLTTNQDINLNTLTTNEDINPTTLPVDQDINPYPTIFLEEDLDGLYSSIIFDKELTVRVIHRLDTKDAIRRIRKGSNAMSNYFACLEGNWSLLGGKYDDDFVITNNNFTGLIDGGEGLDSLHLGTNLDDIIVDLVDGVVASEDKNTNISIRNIDRIIGRAILTDNIICGCDTTYVAAGGGYSQDDPDSITILDECNRKDALLTVVASGFTRVKSNMTQGQLVIVVPTEPNSALAASLSISNNSNTFYLKMPVNSLLSIISDSNLVSCQIILQFQSNQIVTLGVVSDVFGEEEEHWLQPMVIFEELDGLTSRLLVHKATGSPQAFHQLDAANGTNVTSFNRSGCFTIPNYFQLRGGNWRVLGGNDDDVFQILGALNGTILAGNGINSLYLNDGIVADMVVIDASVGEVSFGDSEKLFFSEVQKIYGRTNKSDEFISDCQTTFVSLSGGTAVASDVIHLTEIINCNKTIRVMSMGHTKIASHKNAVNFEAHILPDSNGGINFKANFHAIRKRIFVLHIDIDGLLDLESFTTPVDETKHYSFNLKLAGDSPNVVSLDFTTDEKLTSSPYLISPQITVLGRNDEVQGTLLLSSSDATGIVLHILDSEASSVKRFGAKFIPNIFYLISGSSATIGGFRDDTFVLDGLDFSGHINGSDGSNTLIIGENITSNLVRIDLLNKVIHSFPKKIRVNNVQNIQGRPHKADQIVCACDSQVVNGQSGNEYNVDEIAVPHCPQRSTLTITVPKYTSVVNNGDVGNFTYEILDDDYFEISANHSANNNHTYQFKFSTERLLDLKYERINQSITLKFSSNKVVNLALSGINEESQEFTNPAIKFQETEMAVTEIKVKKSEFVYSSILVKKAMGHNVYGVKLVVNEFWIDLGSGGHMEGIVCGGNEDDTFWLESVGSIGTLNGSIGTNTVVFLPQLYPDHRLFVDLREKSGAIRFSDETALVKQFRNVQILRGRPDAYELVQASCNTKYLESVDEIWFTDSECSTYNVVLEIGNGTAVIFQGDSGIYENIYAGGSFFYKLKTLRSFDPIFDFWFGIRNTLQVYYLKFGIDDLEAITYSNKNSKVQYVISNETYQHSVDKYLELDQQFYAQPQLMTSDGFHIRIKRDGEIFLTLAIPDTDVSLVDIQNDLLPRYGEVAKKLNVTMIVRTKTDFVYIDNRNDGGPNVLTNTDDRSHLVSGEGSNANYIILDLKANVYIYTGLDVDSNETQMVDLTEVVSKIRNETKTKYVPRVVETAEGHLEISVDDFKFNYPGKVIVVDGAKNEHQLKFLFNAVVMQLDSRARTYTGDVESPWNLKPTPIVINEDTLNVITPDDFEYGQEVVVSQGNSSVIMSTNNFQFVRKDNDLILTNMGSSDNMSEVSSLMFFDLLNQDEPRSLDILLDLKIKLGERVIEMNFSDSELINAIEVTDFDDFLERMEETLLEDLPEIKRQFKISLREKLWKMYKHMFVGLIVAGALALVMSIFIVLRVRRSTRRGGEIISISYVFAADFNELKNISKT